MLIKLSNRLFLVSIFDLNNCFCHEDLQRSICTKTKLNPINKNPLNLHQDQIILAGNYFSKPKREKKFHLFADLNLVREKCWNFLPVVVASKSSLGQDNFSFLLACGFMDRVFALFRFLAQLIC